MKILVLWPPQVPSYFNAGHHLTVFNVANHLRDTFPDATVRAVDAGALNVTWKELGDLLVERPDLVAIANDFDAVDALKRTIHYARELAPEAKIVTFGRLAAVLPEFFQQFDVDAIVGAGDPECGVEDIARSIDQPDHHPRSVWLRTEQGWRGPETAIPLLPIDRLPLPDVREIPHAAYERLYADDSARFCGIPGRRELVVPVARGCPVGCAFCDIPGREGKTERRHPVDKVVAYIAQSAERMPFEYVSMYAPTFTLRKPWVREFCTAYDASGIGLPWKCTTTLHHLDDALIRQMGASGCVRISVGLETLEEAGQAELPRAKHIAEERFHAAAESCRSAGVELNCFVILGLPGTSPTGVRHTIERVLAERGRVRPTIYTDFDMMRPEMDEATIASFNRQLFSPGPRPEDAQEYYRLLFDRSAPTTAVTSAIPVRSR
ncbi:B12-binding domain-containing radical SAM protein [Nocardia asiatica]|uniref:B12-binding domain-containing radical SAM protein n=1 Tax=Nocardia asiatica TaxID=209252 RepID=UPI0005C1A203|nr:radical SAM protein [Nocardia asiatica]